MCVFNYNIKTKTSQTTIFVLLSYPYPSIALLTK